MFLHERLRARAAAGRPVRVGLIGAGKFGSMFLSQAPTTEGLEIRVIADLDPDRARAACRAVGWSDAQIAATRFTDDAREAVGAGGPGAGAGARGSAPGGSTPGGDPDTGARGSSAPGGDPGIDVAVEATGDPAAGIAHARAAFAAGTSIVMVNVEADVLAGPLLAAEAREAGVVYTLAYGDQPALTCELVEWARACGFDVVAAGKGTKYLPSYHASTPDTVWDHYGLTADEAAAAGMNSRMFNSFLDGTKSAIEMAAIANATGLAPPPDGLRFPPCGRDDLAHVLRPAEAGGQLHHKGQVEVVSSLERDGRPVPGDLRWGVYVVVEAPNDYSAACFRQYGMNTDDSGRYSAMYKPFHLIGLELNVSILAAALLGAPTGAAQGFVGDVAATAKRDLAAGETLDGEGGYTVYGKLLPAAASLARGALPIGLAHGAPLTRAVRAHEVVGWDDVDLDAALPAVEARRAMEARFSRGGTLATAGTPR